MMVTTCAVALSVLVIKIHFMTPEYKPPGWLRFLAFRMLARLLCMSYHRKMYDASLKKRQRDMTWETAGTDDLKSQNSTLTPDGIENFELLHARRRVTSSETDAAANADCNETVTSSSLHVHHPGARAMHSHGNDVHHPCDNPFGVHYNEWKRIAEIIDRFFFWLFLTCIILPTASILGFVRLFKPPIDDVDAT